MYVYAQCQGGRVRARVRELPLAYADTCPSRTCPCVSVCACLCVYNICVCACMRVCNISRLSVSVRVCVYNISHLSVCVRVCVCITYPRDPNRWKCQTT